MTNLLYRVVLDNGVVEKVHGRVTDAETWAKDVVNSSPCESGYLDHKDNLDNKWIPRKLISKEVKCHANN